MLERPSILGGSLDGMNVQARYDGRMHAVVPPASAMDGMHRRYSLMHRIVMELHNDCSGNE